MILSPFSLPWHEILLPQLSWLEKIARPVLVYLALLVIFRFASKRELAQTTLFDFLIVLLISNVVQNAMIGEDNSVFGAITGALTLVLLSGAFNRLTARSAFARNALEGRAMILVRDGVIDEAMERTQNISQGDLLCAIRKAGLARLADVAYAILELDGSISIIRKDSDPRPFDCLPPEARNQ